MATYVALLRGIYPTNPNTKGEKLKRVFESLGFERVSTVLASGNVIFDSRSKNIAGLEARVEKALPEQLGFKSTTIVRSRENFERLVKAKPFKTLKHEKPNYLVVTFFKSGRREACDAFLSTKTTGPEMMRTLEKAHGKDVTTRTWNTIGRILKKIDSPLAF